MMGQRIAKQLALTSLLLCLVLRIADLGASENPVASLPAHLAESGTPTEGEVALVEGWLKTITPDEAGKPSSQAWLDGWLGAELPFSFSYNGHAFSSDGKAWRFQRGNVQRKADVETQEWSWLHAQTGLKVVWHIKRYLDYPALDTLLTFENTSSKDTSLIEDVQNLDLRLNQTQPGKAYTIHGAHGGRCGLDDFMPFSYAVGSKTVQFGSQPFASNQELPFFNIESPEGRGVLVGLGWTGCWLAQFTGAGTQLEADAGMPKTKFRLHPGEKVRGPRVLLVFWNGQRLHGNNMLRHVLYNHYLPRLPNGKAHEPLVSVNTCFTYHGRGGYLEAVTEKSLLALVHPFLELGVEAYVVDAGYYTCKSWMDINRTKDYSYCKERFPHGFRPISEPLAKAGVVFGLWFSPEAFGNMGDRQAREKFLAVVGDCVNKQGVTMYRQDGGGTPDVAGPDRLGVPEMQQIAGLYEMQDQLHSRYPFMVMEGCCGGGRRIDLESLSRFLWHQKSDSWFKTISDQSGLCGANLYMPGGVINVPTEATDNFGLWSSFAGQLCLAWHPLDKDFPMALATRQVKLYKRVRPLLSGDFYPLTECTLEKPWLAYQFHRNDLNQGFALIFKRTASEGNAFVFAPKGLEPQARYAIRCEGSGLKAIHTGDELAKGIPLTLKKTPEAELVIYERQP
jgi:alpha-galactosidase